MPQLFLNDPSLTNISVPYLRAEDMWDSENMLGVRVGLQRGVAGMML